MAKLLGENKLNTAVFISGRGSNLNSLINFSKKKYCPIKIKLVITNNKEAVGLRFAKKNKIKSLVVKYTTKFKAERKILNITSNNNIKLICLAGFMKILSKNFINNFKGKILNIHPSLLPKYKGLNAHKRALENGERFSGCTVHLVNSVLDSGKIILQKRLRVTEKDSEYSLEKKILKLEHKLYPKAIVKFLSNS